MRAFTHILACIFGLFFFTACDEPAPSTVLVQNNLSFTLDRDEHPTPAAFCEVAIDYADETNQNYAREFIDQGDFARFNFSEFLRDNGITSEWGLLVADIDFHVYCYADREYWHDDEQCGDEFPCNSARVYSYYGDFTATLTQGGVVSLEEDASGNLVIREIIP